MIMLTKSLVLPFLTSSRSLDQIEAGVGETDTSFLLGLICLSLAPKIYFDFTLDTASLLSFPNCCFFTFNNRVPFIRDRDL